MNRSVLHASLHLFPNVHILFHSHFFHKNCIDPWLLEHRTCPMCKCDILKSLGIAVSVMFLNYTVRVPYYNNSITFLVDSNAFVTFTLYLTMQHCLLVVNKFNCIGFKKLRYHNGDRKSPFLKPFSIQESQLLFILEQ